MTELRHGSAEEAGFDPARIQIVRERAAEWITQGRTPQVALIAARRGVIGLCEAFASTPPQREQ